MYEMLPQADRGLKLATLSLLAIAVCSVPLAVAQTSGEAFTREVGDHELEWAPCPDFLPDGCELAVLQGDPGKPNADIFFRLPGGSAADRHWHGSAERMVLVAGELHIDYDGQDPVVMRLGTYAYGPARLPHSAECRSAEPCVLFIDFEQPIDAMRGGPE
jgi:hypothetical protein